MKNAFPHQVDLSYFEQLSDALNNANFIEDARVYLFSKDCKGKFISCNDSLAQDVGFAKGDDVLGSTDFDLCWKNYAMNFRKNDEAIMLSRKPKLVFEPAKIFSGDVIPFVTYKVPLYGSTSKILGVVGVSFSLNNEDMLEKILMKKEEKTHKPTVIAPEAPHLTQRQIDCLFYLTKGMTMKMIAKQLCLSPKTVEHYIYAIRDKMNCGSRSEMIEKALSMQVIREKILF